MARFTELDSASGTDDWIDRVCEGMADGALVAHPTMSVYGLGAADPELDPVVAQLKGRDPTVPILRLVSDPARLLRLFPDIVWPEVATVLADAFWPGPLTLVLDDGSPAGLAVRAESHPATRAILSRWDGTLGSTSLNPAGRPPARTRDAARTVLGAMTDPGRPVLLVAAADLEGPPPSTLLSLRRGECRLLREGATERSKLERVLGRRLDLQGGSG